ncbi:unnamed protein product [Schistosoma mattheei]|nr:unnamed protein product [Schistosoma mattheei]
MCLAERHTIENRQCDVRIPISKCRKVGRWLSGCLLRFGDLGVPTTFYTNRDPNPGT